MKLFVSVLILSAIIHIGILLLPSCLNINEPKKQVVVELQQIEIPKPKPKGRKQAKKQVAKETKNAQSAIKDTKSQEKVKAYEPTQLPTDIALPDILVPKSLTDTEPELATPSSIQTPKKNVDNAQQGKTFSNELASLEAQKSNIDNQNKEKGNTNSKKAKIESVGQIYTFDVLPSNNRSLSYVPPEPEFALENDAKVTIKFSIDKNGNTSEIIFITRNDSRVEKLAYDYVRLMRFEAVLHDEKDTAQITLSFKVRR